MYVKYIFVLCLTYYLRTVNSYSGITHSLGNIDNKEIEILWKSIKGDSLGEYIIYNDFFRNCADDEDKCIDVIKKYGSVYYDTDAAEDRYRIFFYQFKKAVYDGLINRWSAQAISAEFEEMDPIDGYVYAKNIIRYYGPRICASQVKTILKKYGKKDNKYGLDHYNFRRVVNMGLLPEPLNDKIAEMYPVFKMIAQHKEYILYNDLVRVYGPKIPKSELKNIVNKYGGYYCTKHGKHDINEEKCPFEKRRLKIFHFSALHNGAYSILNDHNIKQIIIPKLNPIDEEELGLLWDALSSKSDYIIFNDLFTNYKDDDANELMDALKTYGLELENSEGEDEGRLYIEHFRKAVLEGGIHRWSYKAMNKVFREMITEEKRRNYIIFNDLVKYYGSIYIPYLKEITRKFGELRKEQYQLSFKNFRKVMDIGYLPKPNNLHTIGELHSEYKKLTQESFIKQLVSSKELIKYYGTRISKIQIESSVETKTDKVSLYRFFDLIRAWNSGKLPGPLSDEEVTLEEIETLFKAISSKSEYIVYKDLLNNYKSEEDESILMDVLNTYGSWHETLENDELRMYLDDFKRAAADGRIPRWSKQVTYTVFKEIVPEMYDYYISLSDMTKYYGKSISETTLENILTVYGDYNGGEYHLNFFNFRRVLNIGLLPEPSGDKIATIFEIFDKIIPEDEERSYITEWDLNNLHGTKLSPSQLENVKNGFETESFRENKMYFYGFRKAYTKDDVPKPLSKENEIQTDLDIKKEIQPELDIKKEIQSELDIKKEIQSDTDKEKEKEIEIEKPSNDKQ